MVLWGCVWAEWRCPGCWASWLGRQNGGIVGNKIWGMVRAGARMKENDEEFSVKSSLTCLDSPVKGHPILRQGFVSERGLGDFEAFSCSMY